MSKKVLIITYYWPPSAGSGVQRWLTFSKYLPSNGWDPVIFTPENPDFDLQDPTLAEQINPIVEVLHFPIWEPYQLFRKLKGQKSGDTAKVLENEKKSWKDKLGIWLRGNLLIPDPRVFWVKPAVNFLLDIVDKNQFDFIITTGPPHSLHLIGEKLHRKTGIAWLADFRDPWSKWEFLDTLKMTSWVKKQHLRLEKNVLKTATVVTTISPTFQKEFEQIAGRKIELLTNGFDTESLPKLLYESKPKNNRIEIVYTGIIDSIRDPIPFLKAFQEAFEFSKKEVRLRFVGKVSNRVIAIIQNNSWLTEHVSMEGYVSHDKVFEYYQKANLLLLILTNTKNAKGNIPGKLFEYMATGRPVIALGDPAGDSAVILQSANAGQVFKHEDKEGMVGFLYNFQPEFIYSLSDEVVKYSRQNLTQKLAELLTKHAKDTLS